jgi:hypothetical protein
MPYEKIKSKRKGSEGEGEGMVKAAKSQAPGVQGTGEQLEGVACGLGWVTPGRPLLFFST